VRSWKSAYPSHWLALKIHAVSINSSLATQFLDPAADELQLSSADDIARVTSSSFRLSPPVVLMTRPHEHQSGCLASILLRLSPKADASRIPAQIPLGCRQTDSNARLALFHPGMGSFTSQLDPHSVRASSSTSSLPHALQVKREGHCIRCHWLEDTAGGSGMQALSNDTLVHIASFLGRRVTFQPLRIISHSIHALCLHP